MLKTSVALIYAQIMFAGSGPRQSYYKDHICLLSFLGLNSTCYLIICVWPNPLNPNPASLNQPYRQPKVGDLRLEYVFIDSFAQKFQFDTNLSKSLTNLFPETIRSLSDIFRFRASLKMFLAS